LMQAGYGFEERYLAKSPSRAILVRTLKNLIAIYHKLDETVKETRLTRFIEVLDGRAKGAEDQEEGCGS
jgi:hypothetical protein